MRRVPRSEAEFPAGGTWRQPGLASTRFSGAAGTRSGRGRIRAGSGAAWRAAGASAAGERTRAARARGAPAGAARGRARWAGSLPARPQTATAIARGRIRWPHPRFCPLVVSYGLKPPSRGRIRWLDPRVRPFAAWPPPGELASRAHEARRTAASRAQQREPRVRADRAPRPASRGAPPRAAAVLGAAPRAAALRRAARAAARRARARGSPGRRPPRRRSPSGCDAAAVLRP